MKDTKHMISGNMLIFLNEEQESFREQKAIDESIPCEWMINILLKGCFGK